ncbi:YppE family protein [Cytobacillus gottheilii]|uniref:YppE family protein n=1 Tax=Cytobacillus gottheilii TaxID=859144 RepID=UPI0021478F04|nr:YppE family protein [Cytobacillus gottheilii]
MEIQRLLQQTEKLIEYVNRADEKYKEIKISGEKGDFYTEVKPFADEVKEVNDEWKQTVIQWIQTERPKNIHEQQIDSCHEHIEIISIQSFFPETSRTRFKNLVSSSIYVLQTIVLALDNED